MSDSETDTQTASLQRELPQQQATVPLLRPLHRHALTNPGCQPVQKPADILARVSIRVRDLRITHNLRILFAAGDDTSPEIGGAWEAQRRSACTSTHLSSVSG